eukprot:EC793713.1.p2 GENE.EC793713.1~~EC793713.1.p2  ORF type:complete len:106 (+),score=29.24 EC793713.1:55-372(+)
MAEEVDANEALLKSMNTPLVAESDMPEDMRIDAVEIVTTAIDKFSSANDFEGASKYIKDSLDKKLGGPWHVILGEHFSFEITYEVNTLLFVFWGGNLAVLVFKAS